MQNDLGGSDVDPDPVEASVPGGDGSSTGSEPPLAPRPCRCKDCLFTMRTLRRDAIGRQPAVLPAAEGTYRLGSWWSDGDPDL